jgi:hypothetical protein
MTRYQADSRDTTAGGSVAAIVSLWVWCIRALALAALLMPAGAQAKPSSPRTRIWMRNIVLFPFDDAPARVVRMSGTAVPTRRGRMIDMNDVTSYAVRVRQAEMVMPAATMQVLMNRHIIPQADTAIKQVGVSYGHGVILMRGVLQKGVPVGFTAQAVASVTPDGEMRLTVTRMKAAGFIPKGVMHALGLNLAKVAQPDNRARVSDRRRHDDHTGILHVPAPALLWRAASGSGHAAGPDRCHRARQRKRCPARWGGPLSAHAWRAHTLCAPDHVAGGSDHGGKDARGGHARFLACVLLSPADGRLHHQLKRFRANRPHRRSQGAATGTMTARSTPMRSRP